MDQKETLEKRGNLNDSLYFLYMKSLSESLFDSDLTSKDIKFGDIYKPVWITSTNSNNPFKKITNMFNMSELKKASKNKKLDLSSVQQNSHYDNKYLDTIEMIAGLVADFTYNPKSYGYDSKIFDTFKPLVRSPYWRRGISVSISGSHGAVCDNGDGIVELHITKSNMTEYVNVVIKFEEK